MVDALSPLAPVWEPGTHGDTSAGIGVSLTELAPGSIVQAAAWPGEEKALIAAIAAVAGLELPDGAGGGVATEGKGAFGFAPGRFLVTDQKEGLAAAIAERVPSGMGTVTDLSHGRTALRVSGPKAEWVLSKFFAIDFSLAALPVGSGLATAHHDIFALIQRAASDQFDVIVFRSFARSFWAALRHASAEVGYEVS